MARYAVSPSLWPASSCSMRSVTLAAITSLVVCALGVEGRGLTLLLVVALLLMGMVPPFLNGLAVFAHKHALALAHASRGGKCKERGSPPGTEWRAAAGRSAQTQRGRLGCLLSRARGGGPQEGLVSLLCAGRRKMLWSS